MPDRPRKRPRDFSQAAKLVIDIASGQVEDRPPPPAVIIGGMVAIVALWIRAKKLRLRMTKHTFELFYLDHLGVAKTSSQDWS
jgi:hypothetical protein